MTMYDLLSDLSQSIAQGNTTADAWLRSRILDSARNPSSRASHSAVPAVHTTQGNAMSDKIVFKNYFDIGQYLKQTDGCISGRKRRAFRETEYNIAHGVMRDAFNSLDNTMGVTYPRGSREHAAAMQLETLDYCVTRCSRRNVDVLLTKEGINFWLSDQPLPTAYGPQPATARVR